MWYMRRLLTGVSICAECGSIWELFQVRERDAVCPCGARLALVDDVLTARRQKQGIQKTPPGPDTR
jgi:DNA-directed RNA polymerase subunit RPC12/RpoP